MHERSLEVDERQAGVRAGKGRIQRSRALEQLRSRAVVDAIEAIQVLQAEVVGGPGIEILDGGATCAQGFVQRNADFERRENLRADLLAHCMHILDASREAIGPDDAAVRRLHQLDDDYELAVRDLDRAPQAVANAQQSPYVAEIRI